MKSLLKFRLLVWKNFLIQKRKPIVTAFEIGLPALFSLILMTLRLRVENTPHSDVTGWKPCNYHSLDTRFLSLSLAFSPNNSATRRMMERVNKSLNIHTTPFPNEDEMIRVITLVNNTGGVYINNSKVYLGGIVFQSGFHDVSGTLMPDKNVVYKIRLSYAPRISPGKNGTLSFKSDTSWSTNFMFPPYQIVGPREKNTECNGDPGYRREGFLSIQNAIDDSIMQEILTKDQLSIYRNTSVLLKRHPYPPYKEDNFVLVLQQQFPLVVMLSLVVIVLGMVRDIVLEKERKLKETMKMMGISNWLHWAAWFTKHFLFLLVSVTIMTVFYCVEIDKEKGAVVAETNPFIIFLYLLCYSIATITYCYAVTVFFAKANTGAAVGGILFFCLYIPYFFLQQRYETMGFLSKILACLDFQVAMSFGGTLLGMFEGVGSGIQLSKLADGVSVDDDFSMLMVLVMLLVDSVIHCLIVWYVETVFPGEYGVPQPWYFPILKRYWGCCKTSPEYVDLDTAINVGQVPEMFEKEPNEKAGIKIRNLRKVYGKGKEKAKVAVAGMTLNMYEGQITALLGHNGAGKTTTMSMLTGFYPPTSGTAMINGYDIRGEISEVRSSLGLCPQHDVLFDNLTVEEHVIFFGMLKGVPKSDILAQSSEMLKDMELLPKLKAKSKTLSGGMKRKLSVCIALIGNSKVVFLDEPSSGLDPNARRNIWTVLQKNRAGRTIVLSTHFMDEADLLGDRIAIMAEGIVKCCGSSLFLKKKYGAGYHMVAVKELDCDVKRVIQVVKNHVPMAELESNVGAELSFVLPQNCVKSFEALFTELEKRQKDLGINSFGASVTTMEEVFLKVGESDEIKGQPDVYNSSSPSGRGGGSNPSSAEHAPIMAYGRDSYGTDENSIHDSSVTVPLNGSLDLSEDANWSSHATLNLTSRLHKNRGATLFVQQFLAMFMKRALHTVRNKLVTVTQLIVPLFFTVMGLVALKTLPSFTDMPALKLVASEYGENFIPYASGLSDSDKIAQWFAQQFENQRSSIPVNISNQAGFESDPDIMKYLAKKGMADIGTYNLKYMIAGSFNKSSDQPGYTVTAYFNNQAYHSIAISLGAIYNALLSYFTNSSEYSIATFNHPLPRLTANKIQDEGDGKDFTGFILSFNLTFGMAFLASSFVLFLVKERSVKAKHIQFVSGVHPVTFWSSTLCWDLINFILPCLCLIVTFFAFSITNFTVDLHWLQLILFFFLYGWAMLPYMYFFSFGFSVPSTAYVWITMFNIITGVATLVVIVILSIPLIGLEDVSIVLEWVFLVIFPNFCLSQGVFQFYQNYQNLDICRPIYEFNVCPFFSLIKETNPCCPGNCGDFCLYYNNNYFGWEKSGVGRMMVFLVVQGLVMWLLIFLSEFGTLQRLKFALFPGKSLPNRHPGVYSSQLSRDSMVQEDEDVAKERARIDNTPLIELIRSEKLVLENLTKYYGSLRAVDHLSVGIPAGECFGLLGINGAGKSSTFMMLTGDSSISSGQAYLNSFSLKTQRDLARQQLGYCPQFDALIGQLTGRETLTLFARLRGIPEANIPAAVTSTMKALTLTQYADKECQTYSGGNKRKLSTGIALIGDPDVVFLDEPSTGMDPVARRMLWDVLSRVRDSGRTLVLTSHSMEECEALCTRLAIMVNGHFKCLGSIQHLKHKYGKGFTFTAKVAYPEDGGQPNLTHLMEFMEGTFPNSKLTDIHENVVNYHITDSSLTWAQVFGEIERAREKLHLEDYLVSQTSLEQVFISFARMQDNQ
ncbi:unnamed protein product [Lymnaea stagnalis]|uniref:ABC transporter domain-containing protein n=1 Tax=Lymnaea stagnalis TaxID=6523 RepID=A0AAV2ICK6_LYMST